MFDGSMGGMFALISNAKQELEHRQGIEAQLDMICAAIGMPRKCEDSAGNALKIGDVLSGGTLSEAKKQHDENCNEEEHAHEAQTDKKRVLEVGYKWAVLSQSYSEDSDREAKTKDGRWYETQIKKRKWLKL